jgi:hypothetical protein
MNIVLNQKDLDKDGRPKPEFRDAELYADIVAIVQKNKRIKITKNAMGSLPKTTLPIERAAKVLLGPHPLEMELRDFLGRQEWP